MLSLESCEYDEFVLNCYHMMYVVSDELLWSVKLHSCASVLYVAQLMVTDGGGSWYHVMHRIWGARASMLVLKCMIMIHMMLAPLSSIR
jgi:hypothetical protein